MKFLIDQQLPPALARFLQTEGHDAEHVRELGLKEADDKIIWNRAISNGQVVVSKDEDFWYLAMSRQYGQIGLGAYWKLPQRRVVGNLYE